MKQLQDFILLSLFFFFVLFAGILDAQLPHNSNHYGIKAVEEIACEPIHSIKFSNHFRISLSKRTWSRIFFLCISGPLVVDYWTVTSLFASFFLIGSLYWCFCLKHILPSLRAHQYKWWFVILAARWLGGGSKCVSVCWLTSWNVNEEKQTHSKAREGKEKCFSNLNQFSFIPPTPPELSLAPHTSTPPPSPSPTSLLNSTLHTTPPPLIDFAILCCCFLSSMAPVDVAWNFTFFASRDDVLRALKQRVDGKRNIATAHWLSLPV